MKKVNCMLDSKEYQNKPLGKEIGVITNRLVNASIEIEVEELANKLVKGCTFKPSNLIGKKETDWVSESLFALDFDENTNIETELNRCKELNILPVFGYTSFSHTEEHHKFRLVFCTNEAITDYNTAKKLQLTLMNVFNNCDEKCKNLSRLYFGGRQLIYKGFDNVMDYEDIMKSHAIDIEINDMEIKPHDSKDISNTSNITWLKSKVTKKENNDNYNIKALRNRDSEYLKSKINNPKIVLQNNQAFFDYIKTYDLGRLLELKYPTSFRCILHEDNQPSAGIFINEEGTYIYHCFSCGKSYNIINLVEVLGNFKSRPKAYKFIREIFNLEIMDTEWQREQKELIKENRRVLLSGELERNCPVAYKNIKRNIKYLDQLLLIAEDNVYSEKFTDTDDNVIFFASNTYICDKLGMSPNSSIEVTKKNVLFAYHDLINKIADHEIPEEMLKKSQALVINKNGNSKKYKHINYYSIPSFTTMLFKDIEEQGENWNKNSYSMKGLSREIFYRTEGESVANKLYPQYMQVYDKTQEKVIDRTTTNRSDIITNKIVEIIFDILKLKPYVLEKELIDELSADGEVKTSKKEAERQIKKSLQEILLSYDLQRIRCNKLIKNQYGIVNQNGYPFIIVKNNLQNEGDK